MHADIASFFRSLDSQHARRIVSDASSNSHTVVSPIDGQPLGSVQLDTPQTYEATIARSVQAFDAWRRVPAPERGLLVREIGNAFRTHKVALARILSLEVGKSISEGQGEVQETIDIADFALGLSRQLYGLTMPSERRNYRIQEQWHPLGPIGVISAFNFPNAVWAWNAMLAAVCGDSVVWKPSLLAPLTALATNAIASSVAAAHGHPDLFTLVMGPDDVIGERFIADKRLPLISATGSTRMGRRVAEVVGKRLGRSLLELGGNGAVIVDKSADLSVAIPSIVFGAAGTAGQRCTTTRRLIVHEAIVDEVCARIVRAYSQLKIGNPLIEGNLVGPLINQRAVEGYLHAIAHARQQGATLLAGGNVVKPAGIEGGHYVQPALLRAPASNQLPIAREETFAPILYVFAYKTIDEAIAMNNSVDQGLSSAIFSTDVRQTELFLSGIGSDCGIANVNAGTSGAEIGGAFGGEKDTGGGRESGSDSWKAYMRRQTNCIHYGSTVVLAQGIRFD
jgi:aldehyde dehydrogenase (NAD+)